jgi:hypothetical protein
MHRFISKITDGPVNPVNGLRRRWHRSIVKMGVDSWFTGPPHLWSYQAPRGDSLSLFNQLVVSLSTEDLLEKRNQMVETYSHYMCQCELALEEESSFERRIRISTSSEDDVRMRWHQLKTEKKRMQALAEMDRLGPTICLITQHLNAVTAGDASLIKDAVSETE